MALVLCSGKWIRIKVIQIFKNQEGFFDWFSEFHVLLNWQEDFFFIFDKFWNISTSTGGLFGLNVGVGRMFSITKNWATSSLLKFLIFSICKKTRKISYSIILYDSLISLHGPKKLRNEKFDVEYYHCISALNHFFCRRCFFKLFLIWSDNFFYHNLHHWSFW